MGQNLDSLLKPGPRLSDAPPTEYEEVVDGLTLEERISAEDREALLSGPLYGWRYPVSMGEGLAATPMRYTQEFIERQQAEARRTVAVIWLAVLGALIMGAILS